MEAALDTTAAERAVGFAHQAQRNHDGTVTSAQPALRLTPRMLAVQSGSWQALPLALTKAVVRLVTQKGEKRSSCVGHLRPSHMLPDHGSKQCRPDAVHPLQFQCRGLYVP